MSKIDTFKIVCGMGTSDDWKQLGITDEQHAILNKIGSKGSRKMEVTHEDYLNQIHVGKYEYKVECTSRDNMQYIDKYIVTRVALTDDKSNKVILDNSDGIKIIINEHAEITGGTLKGQGGLVISYDPFISNKYGIKKNCGLVLMKLDDETFALVSADWVKQDIDSEDIKCKIGWLLLNKKGEPIGTVIKIDYDNRIILFQHYGELLKVLKSGDINNDTFALPYDVVKDDVVSI